MVNAPQIIQYVSIVVDCFGVIAGLVRICTDSISFVGIIRGLFTIVVAVFLLLGELYIFSFFRYFGFIFKNWGKGLAYLFMGASLFASSGFGLFVAIIFWIVAIAYFILAFIFKQVSLPLFQGGCTGSSPPSMALDSSEIYENNEKQMDIGHKHNGDANNNANNNVQAAENVDNAQPAASSPPPAQDQYNDI